MKYILLFVHALTITIYSFFFVDPVIVKTNFPESAKPGSEFVAEITINKGSLAGFAKFQLELPQGFSAKENDSKGGSFTLSGQTAKIIWTSVPSSPEFSIKMTIVVDASATGDKTVTGKYSYIENNNKMQTEIEPVTVKLPAASDPVATNTTPTETTAPTATTAATENTNTVKEGDASVSVTRNITAGQAGEYDVELRIKKDGTKGFAKLQEKMPEGYVASAGKTDGSSFSSSVADRTVKFIWTGLPPNEELVVSYKLVPKKGVKVPSPASVEGEFSYLENSQSRKYKIEKQDLPGGTEPVATNTVEPTNTNTVAATDPVKTETTTPVDPVKTETTSALNNSPSETTKSGNVHYAVQVGAFRNPVNVAALSARFGLSGVNTEMQDGLTKCITGKHPDYKKARDARETIKSKGVSDAFVTAYNSGRRITVQEALMITSQKWFR